MSTTTTTLQNGLKIVTKQSQNHFISFGVFINVGTRFENKINKGFSHFIGDFI